MRYLYEVIDKDNHRRFYELRDNLNLYNITDGVDTWVDKFHSINHVEEFFKCLGARIVEMTTQMEEGEVRT